MPYSIDGNLLKIDVLKDTKVMISCEQSINKSRDVYFYGDVLLTRKNTHTDEVFIIDGAKYSYVSSSASFSKEELEKNEEFL